MTQKILRQIDQLRAEYERAQSLHAMRDATAAAKAAATNTEIENALARLLAEVQKLTDSKD